MKVGFIGLGIMGSGMAGNILKAGFPLTVYNRTRGKAEPFEKLGARVVNTPEEVARQSDVVLSIVTDAPDVEQILYGEHGIVKAEKKGLIFVDMSTNSPDFALETYSQLKERGIRFLDAPVTGGDKGAKEGTLTIMVGGDEDVFKQVEPVFKAMGKNVIYVGSAGKGQALKLCNQVVIALDMVAVVEALQLSRSMGIEDEKLFSMLSSGAGNSFTVQYYMPKIMKGDLEPGFKSWHLKKDLKYVDDVASKRSIPMPATSLTLQLYSALVANGLGEKGTQSLIKLYDKLVGK
ncbi:6-phosphogluconate dehydrogenase [Sulfolobales archaeon HS-7]|nr:6-phosphogluconate dehydrogenase [Sulfolobales archaeon HS-7]